MCNEIVHKLEIHHRSHLSRDMNKHVIRMQKAAIDEVLAYLNPPPPYTHTHTLDKMAAISQMIFSDAFS